MTGWLNALEHRRRGTRGGDGHRCRRARACVMCELDHQHEPDRVLTVAQSFPRPLNERESEVLAFVLSGADAALRQQAERATVTARCACGCPTIDLAVDTLRSTPADGVGDLGTTTRLGVEPFYWLTLRLHNGWLSQLRLSYIDEPPPAEFPPIEAFEPLASASAQIPADQDEGQP